MDWPPRAVASPPPPPNDPSVPYVHYLHPMPRRADLAEQDTPQAPSTSQPDPATIKQLAVLATFTIMRMVVKRWKRLHAQLSTARPTPDDSFRPISSKFHDPLKTPLTPPNTPQEFRLFELLSQQHHAQRPGPDTNRRPHEHRSSSHSASFHPYARPPDQSRGRQTQRNAHSASNPLHLPPSPAVPLPTPDMRDHVHRPSPPHQQPTVLNETDQRAFRSSDSTISTSDSNSIPTSPEEKAFLNEYSQRHAAHVHTLATAALTTLSLPSHAVILALLFVKRFLALQELPQALSTPTKVFLAGLLLADAHLCDSTVSMKTWAVITGARGGGSQVTAIKTAALNALQFDVAVGAEFYSRWLLSVKTFFKEDVGRLGQFE